MTFEQLQFATECGVLLPFIYLLKIWQAHNEFLEDYLAIIPAP